MNFKKIFIVFILVIFAISIMTFEDKNVETDSLALNAEKYNLLIGSAVNADYLESDIAYKKIIGEQLNVITTENEMKFDVIHPQKYEYNFIQSDKVVNFAIEYKQLIRGHTLVWHRRIPEWLTNESFSKEEMKKILKEHIQTVVRKYKGKIYAWDVVNEAFNEDGSLKDSIWLRTIGPQYISLSYKWAHEADPDALLFYNDYNIEEKNTKSDAVFKMVKDFKERNIPIHGIGLQMHTGTNSNYDFNNIKQNMTRFKGLGIQSQITELDVVLNIDNKSRLANEEKQKEIYTKALRTCLDVDTCTAFIMWGITDKYTPRKVNEYPLIFDIEYRPKTTYRSLLDVLKEN
ncbi:endo-1,4-beta-xylanase [Niallia circulans]|uniref:endo-1,4-beta-xylanase n=1 Tax=Niallia circulans TaxID=1397 RepID=UPI00203D1873|nr:endo-1,4-beta-xylanase [Niallia circulans]MCM2983524.1 endo-1,4-beta-xylanase [Niallia circulans]